MLAVVGTVLALTGIAIALVPSPSSQAATGQKWTTGVPYAGTIKTNAGPCTVTVVSEWLAITAKHCGRVNPILQLDVSTTSNPGVVGIKSIQANRNLDVEALILQKRTGLPVTPLRDSVFEDRLYTWGYGEDNSNNETNRLTRADYDRPEVCPSIIKPEKGSLCWDTTATNSTCTGDSGGPVTQNGAIIGMVTIVTYTALNRDGSINCTTVRQGAALTIKDMQPWLNQMIKEADPFV